MKQKIISPTPHLLQVLFIVGVLIFLVVQMGFSLFFTLTGPVQLTTISFWLLTTYLVPLGVLIAVHCSRRDRKLSVNSLFQSLLLTFSAFIIFASMASVIGQAFIFFPNLNGEFWYTFLTLGLPLAITVCGILLVILSLRRKKQW